MTKCERCEVEFETKNDSKLCPECKEIALAELDADSDECLSCQ